MQEVYDALLSSEALTPEQRRALQSALEADPALRRAFSEWQRLRAGVRARLEAHLPDRSLLVLYALEADGRGDLLTPEERQALEGAQAPLRRAFEAYPALADVARQIGRECDDFEACWREHLEPAPRRAADRPAQPRMHGTRSLRWAWRVAAVFALVAFGTVALLVLQRDQPQVTVQTAAGEMRLLTLPDGSTVRLMERSSLSYAGDAALGHRVTLQGKAFFDVAPGQEGFTVETPTAYTTVLGTDFGVQADARVTEVVLASGRVSLAPKAARDRIVVLEPGQMSRVAGSGLASAPSPVDLTAALAWTRLFVFRSASLSAIADRLSRHYGVPVALAPALEGQEVTGTFEQSQPLEVILETVAATLGAQVRALPEGGYQLTLPEQP